jgi:hypothetical protein
MRFMPYLPLIKDDNTQLSTLLHTIWLKPFGFISFTIHRLKPVAIDLKSSFNKFQFPSSLDGGFHIQEFNWALAQIYIIQSYTPRLL